MAQIVTITNPLTGQPAQVDQLDYTAQQIDDGLNIARGVSNPNLLDNWYFGNPVDQRGGYVVVPTQDYYDTASTANSLGKIGGYYTANILNTTWATFVKDGTTYYAKTQYCVRGYTGAGYGIDRWSNAVADKTVLIKDNGLYFPVVSDFFSNLDLDLYGKTITYSVLTDKGIISITATMPNTAPSTLSLVATKYESGIGHINMYARDPSSAPVTFHTSFFFDAGVTAIAAKLELGSQQTLAHQDMDGNWKLNEIPNYYEEFLKCVSSTSDSVDTYANVPQRRNNRVIAVNTVNGLTTTVYSNDVTVTISILGNPTSTISKGTALCGTLPEKYRPPIDYFVRSFYDDETTNVVGVNAAGVVTNPLANLKTGAYHRAIFTYSI